jgi:hypothetical protein
MKSKRMRWAGHVQIACMCLPSIIRKMKSKRMRWAGHVQVACMWIRGMPEGKRPLGRSRCRWEDSIKMDLGEIGWGDMDWIDVAQDRDQRRALVNTVMNPQVP